MQLVLPERISVTKVFRFAAVLAVVQLCQHTNFEFMLLFFGFLMCSVYAFNIAGGFSRVSGAYIFWFALLVPIIGVVWKSVLGEPAESNLKAPLLTMSAYTASMVMLALVALVTNKLDFRQIGFSARAPALNYKLAALGCFVFWVIVYGFGIFLPSSFYGVYNTLRQIDFFRQFAIILGTIAVIRESGGRRSVGFISFICMFYLMWEGMLSGSKQGMMTPFVCWLVAATYMRLKLNLVRSVTILFVATLFFTLFNQISQARIKIPEGASYGERASIVLDEIIHYNDLVAFNKQGEAADVSVVAHHYYDSNQNGLVTRLSMISPDDSFFNYASSVPPIGLEPIRTSFEGLIPNFMLPQRKVTVGAGNHYAHEIGGYLAPSDFTTGISFSPIPEAYYFARWTGIFFVLPAIWILLFLSVDFVCGDVKKSPWALLVIVYFGHAAPESLISGLIYYMGYVNFGMVVAILFCTRLAPILGTLLSGPEAAGPPVGTALPRRRAQGQPVSP
jgi:hypothetical protein